MLRKVDRPSRRPPDQPDRPVGTSAGGTPTGISVFTASLVLVPVVVLAGRLPAGGDGRTVALAVFVAVVALVTVDPLTALAMAGIGLLMVIGILRNRYGDLTWQGEPDVVRGLLLAAGAGAGLLAGWVRTAGPERMSPRSGVTARTGPAVPVPAHSPVFARGVHHRPLERNSHDG